MAGLNARRAIEKFWLLDLDSNQESTARHYDNILISIRHETMPIVGIEHIEGALGGKTPYAQAWVVTAAPELTYRLKAE